MKNLSLNNPFTWLVGILAALAIAASGNIDPPSEIDAARDVAADVAQAAPEFRTAVLADASQRGARFAIKAKNEIAEADRDITL